MSGNLVLVRVKIQKSKQFDQKEEFVDFDIPVGETKIGDLIAQFKQIGKLSIPEPKTLVYDKNYRILDKQSLLFDAPITSNLTKDQYIQLVIEPLRDIQNGTNAEDTQSNRLIKNKSNITISRKDQLTFIIPKLSHLPHPNLPPNFPRCKSSCQRRKINIVQIESSSQAPNKNNPLAVKQTPITIILQMIDSSNQRRQEIRIECNRYDNFNDIDSRIEVECERRWLDYDPEMERRVESWGRWFSKDKSFESQGMINQKNQVHLKIHRVFNGG